MGKFWEVEWGGHNRDWKIISLLVKTQKWQALGIIQILWFYDHVAIPRASLCHLQIFAGSDTAVHTTLPVFIFLPHWWEALGWPSALFVRYLTATRHWQEHTSKETLSTQGYNFMNRSYDTLSLMTELVLISHGKLSLTTLLGGFYSGDMGLSGKLTGRVMSIH